MGSERLSRLQAQLPQLQVDWLIISQANHVRYLTGYTGSNGVAVVSADKAIFLTDFRYKAQSALEVHDFDIHIVDRDINADIALKIPDAVRVGFEKLSTTVAVLEKFTELLPGRTLIPLGDPLLEQISVKSADEVAAIQKAIDLSERVFGEVIPLIKPGTTELWVAAELEYRMKLAGGEPSFETIVASGERGAMPHGRASGKAIQAGELVTVDFGTLLDSYCSDITRTFMVGLPTEKQREIYNLVLKAQIAACEAAKPGMLCKDLDAVARTIIAEAGYGDQFGHGLGHGLGLLVHDAPSVSSRSETILMPGMVVTIEPGIYIEGWGGVRIEDDIVITDSGCRVMTSLPKHLVVVG